MHTLAALLTHLPAFQLYGATDPMAVLIDQVVFDSRKVQPHTLFVAWPGRTVDTHRFIAQTVEQGVAAVIGVHSPTTLAQLGYALPTTVPYIQVENSRLALAICAAALHDFPSRTMPVIGITGTDGKTTTCSLLEAIFKVATTTATAPQGQVGVITTVAARIAGAEIDTGFHVTTPDAPDVQRFLAQMRAAGCRYAVVESTSHGLNQARVAAVDFDVAGVTNITHEHLDEHGSREAYVAAKALLFRALYGSPSKPGIPRCAVLNADDDGSFDALQTALAEEAHKHGFTVPVRTYGVAGAPTTTTTPDVVAAAIEYLPSGTRFRLRWWDGDFMVNANLIGEFNVSNVLCAATVALALGLAPTVIQQGISNFAGVLGRMERIDEGQSFLAVVDFAHSPVSLERALITLRKMVGQGENGQPGRLIAVFGSAGLRDVAKRRLMGRVSGRLADFTVVTAEDPRTEELAAINAAIAAGVEEFAPAGAYTIVPDRAAAIQFAVDMARPGDIVASFGKGHERSMCFGETEYPWSDQDAMRTALKRRLSAG
ncbi:MAG: UDP-N-acetylmuramoyl-L-alanyl-D-glutamate--2,6-diaminopimelate ligase [Caldilinea sp. CFX5]|nr:UDP-N-acetylmuramoyl-L-alanyl-D-glutamate--2,6-diaminopimelate ligase [Caldilinea sp. CFX5]